jgi:hypothetical protein
MRNQTMARAVFVRVMALLALPVTVTDKRPAPPEEGSPLHLMVVALTSTGPCRGSQSIIPVDKWPRRQIGPGSANEGYILEFIQRK